MKEIIKKILRFLNLVIIKPKNPEIIEKLKQTFIHNERSFVYCGFKYLIDCLYCHASPGVMETIIIGLAKLRENNEIKGNKILNMGGGTGQVSSVYEALGFDVYNLDIEITSNNNKNIKFDLNQNIPIPFPEKTFDVVLCQEIIEHVENPWKIFRDTKNILKDGGIMIVTTPNILSLQSKFMFLFTGFFKWFTPSCFDYHINPIPFWEVTLIANKCGFETTLIRGSGDYFFNRGNKNHKKILRNNESLIFFFKKL